MPTTVYLVPIGKFQSALDRVIADVEADMIAAVRQKDIMKLRHSLQLQQRIAELQQCLANARALRQNSTVYSAVPSLAIKIDQFWSVPVL